MTAPHSARLVVFAKAPQAGQVKTRLTPALGAEGASALAHRMLAHVLQQALQANAGPVELCMSQPPGDAAWNQIDIPAGVLRTAQGEGDLGERMARAVRRVTAEVGLPVLLMGSDCPALTTDVLQAAARRLQTHDALLVPVADGGYVLIGLKSPCPALFDQMPWSTASVATETLSRMAALGFKVWCGPLLHDIDEPADLAHLPADFHSP